MVTFDNVKKADITILLGYGFSETETKTQYELVRMEGPCALVLYNSGKLVLQGSKEKVKEVARVLNKIGIGEEIKKTDFKTETGVVIGSDEVLKGDTFGGLVVVGVKANDSQREKLRKLGIEESKQLSDKKMHKFAEKIKKIVECSIKNIYPEEYNKYEITPLLNRLHKEVKLDLGEGLHIVDKYPGCNAGDFAVEKADAQYLEVAAASIIARDEGLSQIKVLSDQAGFEIPLGSTHVKDGLKKLKEKGLDFEKFVKIKFKNVKEFLQQ